MKKVFILVESLETGGVQRLIIDDITEMQKRGIDVHLVTLRLEDFKKSLSAEMTLLKEKWHIFNFNHSYAIRQWLNLIRLIKKEKPDAVFSHMWRANNIGRIAAFISSVPYIIAFEHSVYDTVKSKKQFFIDRLLQYVSTKIVAVSQSVKSSLVAHGIKENKIAVVYNGIDQSRFKQKVHIELSALEKKNHFNFMFIGRLVPAKDLDSLISAFALFHLGNGHHHAKLIIIGDGGEKNKLQKLVEQKNIQQAVSFLGYRLDIPELLQQADCLILPSKREGLGTVLIEALASSVPVIVSDFPAAQEIFKNNENALVFKMGDVNDLAKKMNTMVEDKVLYLKLQRRGHLLAEGFTIGRHVDTLIQLCK